MSESVRIDQIKKGGLYLCKAVSPAPILALEEPQELLLGEDEPDVWEVMFQFSRRTKAKVRNPIHWTCGEFNSAFETVKPDPSLKCDDCNYTKAQHERKPLEFHIVDAQPEKITDLQDAEIWAALSKKAKECKGTWGLGFPVISTHLLREFWELATGYKPPTE